MRMYSEHLTLRTVVPVPVRTNLPMSTPRRLSQIVSSWPTARWPDLCACQQWLDSYHGTKCCIDAFGNYRGSIRSWGHAAFDESSTALGWFASFRARCGTRSFGSI